MDALVLLGSLLAMIAIGVPVAYALGIASLAGALWIDIPLDAVMLKISDGVDNFALLAIPFFVLAGAIMAEGGMARRLVAFAAGWRWSTSLRPPSSARSRVRRSPTPRP